MNVGMVARVLSRACSGGLAFLLFLLVSPAFAQRVQSGESSCSWATSCQLSFTSNVAAGDAVVVAVYVGTWETGPQTPTLSDAQGNSYTLLTSVSTTFLFCTPKVSAGADSVSSSVKAAQAQYIVALEFKGSCTVDQSTTATGSSASVKLPAIATHAGDFLAGAATSVYGNTFKASGLTVEPGPGNLVIADGPDATTGNTSAAFTLGSSTNWTALLVAFSPSATAAYPTFNVTATVTWSDGTAVTGTVAIAQATAANSTATNSLGSFPLSSSGVATGSITPNLSLPLTFFITLINPAGTIVNTMTMFANTQILQTIPQTVNPSIVLVKSTGAVQSVTF